MIGGWRRLAVIAVLGVASLAGVLLFLLSGLLFTTSGAQLMAQVARGQEPRLELRIVDGSLFSGLHVRQLGWRDEALEVTVDRAVFRWQPLRLLGGELPIETLTVRGVDVVVPPSAADKAPEPARSEAIVLPRIELPIAIDLARFVVDTLRLEIGDAPVQRFKRIEGSIQSSASEWQIGRLQIEREDARLDLHGTLHTAGAYPLALLARGTVAVPGFPERQRFATHIGGSVAALRLSGDLSGPVSGALELDLRPLEPSLPFRLETQGFAAGWPLDSRKTIAVDDLDLLAHGDINGVEGRFSAAVDGEPIPAGRWQGEAVVDAKGAVIESLEGRLLNGALVAGVRLGWGADGIEWHVDAHADGLDPSQEWSQAPQTAVSGPVTVAGGAGGEGWTLQITSPGLSGVLEGREVALRGAAERTLAGAWHIDDVRAALDGGELHLDAQLAEQWQLALDAQFADLSALDPRLRGALTAQARVEGEPGALEVFTTGSGTELGWQAYRIDALAWDAVVPALGREPGEVAVTVAGVDTPQVALDEVEIQALGSRAAHHLSARAAGPDGHARLALAGGWLDGRGWHGLLADAGAEIHGHAVELERAFLLRQEQDHVEVAPHCWRYREAKLCFDEGISAGAQAAAAQFRLADFELAWLEPWLPDDVKWQGPASGAGSLDWSAADGLRVAADVESRDGLLAMTLRDDFDDMDPVVRDLHYQHLALSAELTPERTELALDFASEEAGRAQARLSGDLLQADAPIDGTLQVDALRIGFFRPFLPDLNHLEGWLNAQVEIAGQRAAPLVEGTVSLRDGEVGHPVTPTVLEGVAVEFGLRGREAEIGGGFKIGDRPGQLSGSAQWSTDDWQLDLELDAERLPVEAPPYADLLITPALALHVSPHTIRVSGRVGLPEGAITVRELPQSAVGHSRDVVVVRRPEEEQVEGADEVAIEPPGEAWGVEADVEVVFGDAVALEAMGVQGYLGGALRVRQTEDSGAEGFGELRLVDSEYRAYGQRLRIRRGVVLFSGAIERPELDIEAVRRIERDRVTAGVRVSGFADDPVVTLFTEPPMGDEDALSYLVRGRPIGAEGPGSDAVMAQAAVALGINLGGGLATAMADHLGVEEFEIDAVGEGEGAQVVVSGFIRPRLHVAYGVGVFTPVNTLTLRYYLTWQLYLEAISGADSSLDLMYRFEVDR